MLFIMERKVKIMKYYVFADARVYVKVEAENPKEAMEIAYEQKEEDWMIDSGAIEILEAEEA